MSDQTPTVMPALFVGHGSPTNTFDDNRWTRAWAEVGRSLPRPRAILAISAHWYINATAVTAMAQPPTIHDFFGFGEDLFGFEYPAPGDPDLADEIVELVDPIWVGLDRDSWGLDHGTWSVLAHLHPTPDVPVLQLSVDATKPAAYHVALGAALAPLRRQGVLILGSGNVVHNLGGMNPADPEGAFDWNRRFDEAATALLADRPGDIAELVDHPDYARAAPTPDHLLPLFYVAGAASADGVGAEVMVDGYAYGSLSMTSYVVGGSLD